MQTVGVDDHIDPWFLFSPCLRIYKPQPHSRDFYSCLSDAARRPTGTPVGEADGNLIRFVSHKSLCLSDEPPLMLRCRNTV